MYFEDWLIPLTVFLSIAVMTLPLLMRRGRGLAAIGGAAVIAVMLGASPAYSTPFAFNGGADNAIDEYGYYYVLTGGNFPTGNSINGSRASGGTMSFVNDEAAWGYPVNSWQKDGWFEETASVAMTFKNEGAIVYDNNGIENGTTGGFYETPAGQASGATPGLYRGYSMANNYDWVYAGYFLIEEALTVDTLIAYFDETAGFDRNNPMFGYAMNVWSNVAEDLLPYNTGSFEGDVFHMSTLTNPGAFSTSDTGVDRVFGDDYGNITDDIFRLTLQLREPIVFEPGRYWFNSNAFFNPVPEPGSLAVLVSGLAGIAALRRRKKKVAA